MLRPSATVTVAPSYPEPFERLSELCNNLYWTWNPVIREFLRSIDPGLWSAVHHDPLAVLNRITPARWQELAGDKGFIESYHAALGQLENYTNSAKWYDRHQGKTAGEGVIAYLSAEFGLHESVPLYSGGLGVLSGDHAKAASDLGLPMVCISLMYQKGYFRQHITAEGDQLENYELNIPPVMPMHKVCGADGKDLMISVEFPTGPVYARLWQMNVGTLRIILLDTNIPENQVGEHRDIADYLYGGDQRVRIMQEKMLGIGGLRALRAMGIDPQVIHCNEGHSAFLLLERARMYMEEFGLNFSEAAELTASGAVFTTHTPVPAGNDTFPEKLMEEFFGDYRVGLGLKSQEFMTLGRVNPRDEKENFSMTVLALKMSSKRNGVSRLHGEVSRRMWKDIWPLQDLNAVPIGSITNGVHTHTWIGDHMAELFDTRLGADWPTMLHIPEYWQRIYDLPDKELWEVKRRMHDFMMNYVRIRLAKSESYSTNPLPGFHPQALTIGFARRFATYKRATLLFSNPDRVRRIFLDPERPVQMLIAGKAHPKDQEGKQFIRQLMSTAKELDLSDKIVFLEDYDMAVGRMLVQGCDVWLNTPRRPLEASGTSGMKAAINGTLNLSILDGWYPEGYNGKNGFAIGDHAEFASDTEQDQRDAAALYHVLENEVMPGYFNRNGGGLPLDWIARMKDAMCTLIPLFSAQRMVAEYTTQFYLPCQARHKLLKEDKAARAKALTAWKLKVYKHWGGVSLSVPVLSTGDYPVIHRGQSLTARIVVSCGMLDPADIGLEAYTGTISITGDIQSATVTPMTCIDTKGNEAAFECAVSPETGGYLGLAFRATPHHPDMADNNQMGLETWSESIEPL